MFFQSPVGFVEEFFRKARIPINEDVNLLDAIGERFPFYSEICYEATFTLAFALQNVIKGNNPVVFMGIIQGYILTYVELETDPLFNKEAAQLSGLSDGEVFTLDNFTYSNSAILKRMYYHINNTDFLGITVSKIVWHFVIVLVFSIYIPHRETECILTVMESGNMIEC